MTRFFTSWDLQSNIFVFLGLSEARDVKHGLYHLVPFKSNIFVFYVLSEARDVKHGLKLKNSVFTPERSGGVYTGTGYRCGLCGTSVEWTERSESP